MTVVVRTGYRLLDVMANVVRVRRIPFGFFENEMFEYFSQFGKVTRLKLIRSEKTGRSRGTAFVEFQSSKVAEIVASTMNNYLLLDSVLKCEVLPPEKIRHSLFKDWRLAVKGHQRNKAYVKKANKQKQAATIVAMCRRLNSQLLKANGLTI
ncbi:RRM 1 domain containing protein [Trichuris trichiura]|uniref:RRM 1 domain containing protein n=1 Tax=Trichuris trichiura TaxID=36087 RepID=A0A077ZDN1_TRITR|nr:RRM 1 domain containing protein [Trichuris trichiura]